MPIVERLMGYFFIAPKHANISIDGYLNVTRYSNNYSKFLKLLVRLVGKLIVGLN